MQQCLLALWKTLLSYVLYQIVYVYEYLTPYHCVCVCVLFNSIDQSLSLCEKLS